MRKIRTKKAFTIFEIIVVLVILLTLAAIALPKYTRTTSRVKVREAEQVLFAIYGAQNRAWLDFGAYSPSLAGLDIDIRPMRYWANVGASNAATSLGFVQEGTCRLNIDATGVISEQTAGTCDEYGY